MKQLYQNDPRWKDQKIGLQNSLTIGQVGCMLSCLAMTVNYFGGSDMVHLRAKKAHSTQRLK